MADLELRHVHTDELESVRQQLLDVYAEVYAEKLNDPFFSVARFDERLSRQTSRNNWEAVIAYEAGEPVGYAFAATLQADARWWMYLLNPLSEDYTYEDGVRTLALFEIMVRRPWRGTGTAQRIHEELLSGRSEERVTLLVNPTTPGVKRLYESWGYEHVGDQKPFEDSPLYATMVRQLRAADAA